MKREVEDAGENAGQRFLVDLMLMRLGRWLRLLGQDVAIPAKESDKVLLDQAKAELRTIITRDRGLFQAARGAGVLCLLIRSSKLSDQLAEMARAGLPLRLDPKWCTMCNGPLDEVDEVAKGEIAGRKRWRCRSCRKLYWVGSHWKKMEDMLQEIRSRREKNAG
ncbi:MAG: hypothetical protein A4E49_01834 [Methanosaeta sp. PtaU1.Bin112]|nr:MAG: hypothetical protein A4E49_01834 [Methanosaeta sp. PtaU1.Bin112]